MPAPDIRVRHVALPGLGLKTRRLEAGAGRAALMLHGNPDSADEWAPLIARLSRRHRCIAPDFPGYGKSPATTSPGFHSRGNGVILPNAGHRVALTAPDALAAGRGARLGRRDALT